MFERVFIVVNIQPTYHASTDAITGSVQHIEDAFNTYEEALDFIASRDDHDWDNQYRIDHDVTWEGPDGRTYGKTRSMHSLLRVNSYYTGPSDWDNVPF